MIDIITVVQFMLFIAWKNYDAIIRGEGRESECYDRNYHRLT